MADIVPINRNSLSAFLSDTLASLDRDLIFSSKGWKLPAGKTLSPEARELIRSEAEALQSTLCPATQHEATAAIMAMLDLFPGLQSISDGRLEAMALGYWSAADDIPLWGINDAIRAIMRGEDDRKDKTFSPSPPQFRTVCLSAVAKVRSRVAFLRRMADVLDGDPVFDDAHRSRMLKNIADLGTNINQPAAPAQEG